MLVVPTENTGSSNLEWTTPNTPYTPSELVFVCVVAALLGLLTASNLVLWLKHKRYGRMIMELRNSPPKNQPMQTVSGDLESDVERPQEMATEGRLQELDPSDSRAEVK